MAQPSDIAKQLKQQKALPGVVDRQYRPATDPMLPQSVKEAFRQIPDQIYNLRQNFGPTNIAVTGTAPPVQVTDAPLSCALTLKLNRPGIWSIAAAVALAVVGDSGSIFTFSLSVAGGRQGLVSTAQLPGNGQIMVHQNWSYTSRNGNETCVLLVQKNTGSGTSNVVPTQSTLVATYAGTS
jgi:hypothetical protein